MGKVRTSQKREKKRKEPKKRTFHGNRFTKNSNENGVIEEKNQQVIPNYVWMMIN